MRNYERVATLGLLLLGVVTSGCSGHGKAEPKFIEDVRPVPPAQKVLSYTIQRRDLQNALVKIGESPIRLVPVYQSVSAGESYEYRIFDVRNDSVYALLGIENSDILVAADRYLVKNPAQFPVFVQLLSNENEATIEIRREGESRLMRYTFIPPVQNKK